MELRDDKPYRRGLVLGLTMAETMILLVFALLLALTTSLSARDQRISKLETLLVNADLAGQLMEVIHRQFPNASTFDEYFKELKAVFVAAEQMKVLTGESSDPKTLMEDARLGAKLRQAAQEAGVPVDDYAKRIKTALSQKPSGWPPFINLSEADGYFFASGRAELKPEFQQALETRTIVKLKGIIDQYNVNVVEVIGHTDEVPMKGDSNLDDQLIGASQGHHAIGGLISGDNAGLGMARAVSVVKVLRADSRLAGITILPLSGAQMIVPIDHPADGTQTGDTPNRRRIEIRVRKSTSETQ